MPEELRVDTGLVRDAGGRLQEIAADLPDPPAAHRPAGTDALSAAIAAKVTEVVDPVLAQMPIAKQALMQYAQKVVAAADGYDAADRQIADEILKRVGDFDEMFGGGGPAGTGGAAAGLTSVAGANAPSPAAAGAPTGAAQQGGQLGSMMQMPMQMAQQAAQAPMQMAGMAGAAPQALQQGAQQALQQVGQLSEATGGEEPKAEEPRVAESDESREGLAAAGSDNGERSPDALAPAQSDSAEQNRPGPEILL